LRATPREGKGRAVKVRRWVDVEVVKNGKKEI